MPLLLIVTIWLRTDDIAAFEEFERKAASIMRSYGGKIERAIRLDSAPGGPFEIHIVSFPDEGSFDGYRADPATLALASERERLIARTEIVRGRDILPYSFQESAEPPFPNA
jgi:hypothetical protein